MHIPLQAPRIPSFKKTKAPTCSSLAPQRMAAMSRALRRGQPGLAGRLDGSQAASITAGPCPSCAPSLASVLTASCRETQALKGAASASLQSPFLLTSSQKGAGWVPPTGPAPAAAPEAPVGDVPAAAAAPNRHASQAAARAAAASGPTACDTGWAGPVVVKGAGGLSTGNAHL